MSDSIQPSQAFPLKAVICKVIATILFAIFWPPFAYVCLLPTSDIDYMSSVPGAVASSGYWVNLVFEISVTMMLGLSILYNTYRPRLWASA